MGKFNPFQSGHYKSMCRKLLIISLNICLLFLSNFAIGQTSPAPKPIVITPKSPNVAAMEKYGNFEVNLFHGVPEIKIPIYEVKSKGFNIPINLSYHASGIKVTDVASWVGLGWSINAGGQISRNVKGKDDLHGLLLPNNGIKTPDQVNPNTPDGYWYLKDLSTNKLDGEPDVFSYSMPGKYGNFLYKNPTSPVLIPSEPIRIVRDQIPQATSPYFRFNLLDEHGNNYLYGKTLNGEPVVEFSNSEIGGNSNYYASSWMLTHSISSDKSDTVTYSYYPLKLVQLKNEVIDNVSVTDNIGCCKQPTAHIVNTTTSSNFTVHQHLIKEIEFDNGKVEFLTSIGNRRDLSSPTLDKILIYNKTKGVLALLKTVRFYYSYFGISPVLRLKLDSIAISPSDGQASQSYRFTYNEQPDFPNFKNAQDYWGYFNSQHNSTLVPRTTIPYYLGNDILGINTAEIGTANRLPNPNVVQSNILKRIQFPTGGYTIFNYEPNKFSQSAAEMIGGGVRIQSILSYPNSNTEPIIKSYKYGTVTNKESGIGILNSLSTFYYKPKKTSSIVNSPSYYLTNDNSIYSTSMSYDQNEYDNSNLFYPFVTEYIGTSEVNLGKKVYEFSMVPDHVLINYSYGFMPQVQSYHWKRGKLLQLKEYEKLIGPDYRLKKETTNFYSSIKPETIANIGLNVVHTVLIHGFPEDYFWSGSMPRPYTYSYYNLFTGAYLPTESLEKVYGSSNNVETRTKYRYNQSFQPSIVETLKSNRDTLITRYKYADDYSKFVNSTNGSGILNLQNSNILSLPIEKTVSIKVPGGAEKVVGGEIKTYYENRPLLKDEYHLETDRPIGDYQASSINESGLLSIPSVFKKRISYTKHDASGNTIEFKTVDSSKNSFIWGYKKNLLIAEAQNAGADQIAYTSFEEEGKGNWTYNDAAVTSPLTGAVTGKSVFNFAASSGSILKSDLSKEQYIVSYWGKKNCLVNGETPTTMSTGKSGIWTLYAHLVTPISGVIKLTSNDAVIDELRLYPASALMKTYTHMPFVGVTSVGQSNNNFNIYSYDGLQRLIKVKDQNSEIIQSHEYNITNREQLNSRPVVFTNRKVSKTYTRINCSSLHYGTTVKYEIEEGAFYSSKSEQDAQRLADSALVANGQQYANINGECRLKTEVIWEPIEPYCQVKQLNVPPTSTTGYSLFVQSAPNTINYASVTISRGNSQYAAKVIYSINFGMNGKYTSYTILEAEQASKTFNISVYPYKNDSRSGWNIDSVELYNNLYVTETSFYARRQKKVGGQVVLTEPNLKGVGEGPYYDVFRSTIEGYSTCRSGYVFELPIKAAYANTDVSASFKKVCAPNQNSSSFLYTVPAGRYTSSISQADANAKATADVNANGQAYVNTIGSCW